MNKQERINTITFFLNQNKFLTKYKFVVTIVDDEPVVFFDSISNKAATKLSKLLHRSMLTHIKVIDKSAVKRKETPKQAK